MIEPKSRGVLDRPVKPDDDNSLWKSGFVRRSSTSEGGSDEPTHSFVARDGLLRGACHRARVRATRWLAITVLAV
jgi:hypothetical protein